MRMKRKTKDLISKIVSVALVIATVVGIGALVGHFVSNKADEDGRVVINPSYEIGGLTAYGKYEETKESIYTKEAFKCDGLNIEPQFDSTITYQVFFYDNLGNFVSSTSSMEGYYTDEIPTGSSYARIVITPKWDKDTKDDDKKINIFQVSKYAKQLTVKINAEQRDESKKFQDTLEEYTEVELSVLGRGIYDQSNQLFTASTTSNWYFYDVIDVSSTDSILVKVPTELLTAKVAFGSSSVMDALVYYDLTNNTTLFAEKLVASTIYSVEYTDSTFTFFKLNVSNVDEIVLAVNEASVNSVQAWLM